uniref:Transmembrane protein n=1 Tax=Glycine max TaxID=3847 RepID=A0A0R0JFR1_SOYBN
MDTIEQEKMQFLGHLQRILKAHIFGEEDLTQITFTLNLPLSFIFLIHIQVSDLLFGKITHDAKDLTETLPGTPQHQKLLDTFSSDWATFFLFKLLYFVSLLIFSLLSTSAIVYTVASFYTGKEVTFKKVLSVVPKLWKRLMVTFLCTVVAFFAYNVIEVLVLVGSVYLTVVWLLASVTTVLEDSYGNEAMMKSKDLIKGKMVLVLDGGRQRMEGVRFGVDGQNSVFFLLLSHMFLLMLVIQTVMYFVCKS